MGVLDFLKSSTVDAVGKVIDNVFTNDEEKSQAKKELTEVVLKGLNDVAAVQGEVIKTEMSGNWIQKSWRPIMMLAFGVILICKWFGLTNEAIPLELELQLLDIVKLGLGGYVVGRSVEKVATTVTKNVDMPFLKKKNRSNIS
jgi:hypothetical protein